jgi:nitrate/nitrite transporter NarK
VREMLAPFALAFAAGWLVSNVGAVAAPMADAYGVSLAFVGALAAAAVATHALMQLPSGRLIDRYGARAAAIGGLSILVAADGIGALAADPALALVARLVVGVGTALCFVAGSDLLRARRAPALAQGLYGGTAMSGAGLALALLPQVGHDASWRVSWLSAAVLAALALVVVALSTTRGGVRPHPLATGAQPASVVRDRRLYRLAVLYTASYGSSVLVGNWVVTFLERAARYSAREAGAVGALTLFGGILSRPFGGWIVERRRRLARPVLVAGLLAGAAGTAALALAPPLAACIVAAAAVGIGAGVPFGLVFSSAQRLRPDRPAAAVGFVNFTANAAIVAGVPLVGLAFSLPGNGRVGLVAVACLWAAALFVLPRAGVLTPPPSSRSVPMGGDGLEPPTPCV